MLSSKFKYIFLPILFLAAILVGADDITMPLEQGWNLISYPPLLEREAEDIFAPIADNLEVVFMYNASSPGGEWKSYSPDRPAFLNTLTKIDPEYGYWIKMDNADSLELEWLVPYDRTYNLNIGWNLISSPYMEETNISEAFAPINNRLQSVFSYDAFDSGNEWKSYNPDRLPFLNTLITLKPERGYWILVNDTMSILHPNHMCLENALELTGFEESLIGCS